MDKEEPLSARVLTRDSPNKTWVSSAAGVPRRRSHSGFFRPRSPAPCSDSVRSHTRLTVQDTSSLRAPTGSSHDLSGHIRVCCRVRPSLKPARASTAFLGPPTVGSRLVPTPSRTSVLSELEAFVSVESDQRISLGRNSFSFDHVFRADASQAAVYCVTAQPIVESVLDGFNGTILAYGQTSSGKTHTMVGPKDDPGIMPAISTTVFERIQAAPEHIEFVIRLSVVEIHNEHVRDLLDPSRVRLKIREDLTFGGRGVFIEGCSEQYLTCPDDLTVALSRAQSARAVGVTNMNEHSSRSHLILKLEVEQRDDKQHTSMTGRLHLVDLAGSERVSRSGASGTRLDEARYINRSLAALGNVIHALADRQTNASIHVPYRDSKLTRILQESLGGNAKTCLVVNVATESVHLEETLSTLRFGQRASQVANDAHVNVRRSPEQLEQLLQEALLRVAFLERAGAEGAATWQPFESDSEGICDTSVGPGTSRNSASRGCQTDSDVLVVPADSLKPPIDVNSPTEDPRRASSALKHCTAIMAELQQNRQLLRAKVQVLEQRNSDLLAETKRLREARRRDQVDIGPSDSSHCAVFPQITYQKDSSFLTDVGKPVEVHCTGTTFFNFAKIGHRSASFQTSC